MASKLPGWVKVTGVGCIVVIVLGIASVVGTVFFFRDAIKQFETADSSMEDVEEQFGSIPAFHPRADGTILPGRIEAFLESRDTNTSERLKLERSLALLSGEGDAVRFAGIRKVTAGVRLLHGVARFLADRNAALLEADMGLGEYYYIYTLAYYPWLGKSPDDGPSFRLVGDSGYVLEEVRPDLTEAEVREVRTTLARESLNRLLLPVLRNQLADLEAEGSPPGLQEWREALEAEIAALEGDARRLPWEDGLPTVIETSLEPYRGRFERSYSAMCNALEIGVARR
jgi:hypothetical protein